MYSIELPSFFFIAVSLASLLGSRISKGSIPSMRVCVIMIRHVKANFWCIFFHSLFRRSCSTCLDGFGRTGKRARSMHLWWILMLASAPKWRRSRRRSYSSITSWITSSTTTGGPTDTSSVSSSPSSMLSVSIYSRFNSRYNDLRFFRRDLPSLLPSNQTSVGS